MLRAVLRTRGAAMRRWTRSSRRGAHADANALRLTDRAVERLRLIAREGERLRITVEGGGCAGFEYKLVLDGAHQSDDVIVERNGAAVIVDEISLDLLKGSTIDYTEEMMRSAFRITENPLATQGCSCGASFAPKDFAADTLGADSDDIGSGGYGDRERAGGDDGGGSKRGGGEQRRRFSSSSAATAGSRTLLSVGLIATVRDYFDMGTMKLDEDPLKDKVKHAMLYRNRRQYARALDIFHEVLELVKTQKDELSVTRVLYEIALTKYADEQLDEAEELLKFVVARLVQMHDKTDSSPQFIGISLKLADIYTRRGDLVNAETGLRHCVAKQMQVMDDHMKQYYIAKGAHIEDRHKVDHFGAPYSDPLALFGMCLEQYAHFLINNFDASREAEAIEYMDEVVKLSFHIYGPSHQQSIVLLNNFGAACILRNRFELARKYLSLGVERILHIDECADIIVGYYCNYSEALFHIGRREEAARYADTATRLARSQPPHVRDYADKFARDLTAEVRRARRPPGGGSSAASMSSWMGWLWGDTAAATDAKPAAAERREAAASMAASPPSRPTAAAASA